jgi:protein transport protein SEC24
MRMTLNYVPASHDLLRTSQMPLAVIIQPLAIPEAGDDQLQVRCPPPPCRSQAGHK